MDVIISNTIRDLVHKVNEHDIKKDSIVTLLKNGEQFILIYYK
jgi:hypothetical protein